MASFIEDLQKLNYELSTELRLVRVGLKDQMHTASILKRYGHLADPERAKEVKAMAVKERSRETKEKLYRQYFALLRICLAHALSEKQDELQTFLAQAEVSVNGESLPYYNIQPLLKNEPDFDRREALGASLAPVQEKANPILAEMIEKQMNLLKNELGYKSYMEYCREKKDIPYTKFAQTLEQVLARTMPLYLKAMISWVDARLGRPFREIRRFHVPYLFASHESDRVFEKDRLLPIALETFEGLGLCLENYPNIELDLESRPGKNPRASIFSAHVPGEIHLVIKPVGGLDDYESFFHESGHAFHYGSTDAELPYEFRHLARSYALSETYAFLFQNLTMDTDWLTEAAGIDPKQAADIRRARILFDLFMFRRYVGKFTAELAYYQKENWLDPSLYETSLRSATQFVYEPAQYLLDQDAEFYSADYLYAWLAEAQLQEYMKAQFSQAWFRNPQAGAFLLSLWREGDTLSLFDLLKKIGGNQESTAALERRFAQL